MEIRPILCVTSSSGQKKTRWFSSTSREAAIAWPLRRRLCCGSSSTQLRWSRPRWCSAAWFLRRSPSLRAPPTTRSLWCEAQMPGNTSVGFVRSFGMLAEWPTATVEARGFARGRARAPRRRRRPRGSPRPSPSARSAPRRTTRTRRLRLLLLLLFFFFFFSSLGPSRHLARNGDPQQRARPRRCGSRRRLLAAAAHWRSSGRWYPETWKRGGDKSEGVECGWGARPLPC
mmetsp:Transcript_25691/g.102480  ORF Transcript_25691/g.102480 Transcript_25691/m.102480 type:complete len:230 (+) Transcript_25691:2124-2813(+)